MIPDTKTLTYVAAGAAALLVLAGFAGGGKKKKKSKALYRPGDTVDALMGQLFTVRMPRGEYKVVADKIILSVQVNAGSFTDVVFIVGASHAGYQEKVFIVELGSGRSSFINVNVKVPG